MHVSQHEADRLVLAYCLAELLPRSCVVEREIVRALGQPYALRGYLYAAHVERGEGYTQPIPFLPSRFSAGTRTFSR